MAGPDPKRPVKQKQQDQNEEEKKDVSCIVKFRPCKDWRGEYGFDWVREGPDDYEEKIELKSVGSDKLRTYFSSYDYYKDRITYQEFNETQFYYDRFFPIENIPPEIANDMLKKRLGDVEYEAWRERQRKALTGDKFLDDNGQVVVDNPKTKKSLEYCVDHLAVYEIYKDNTIYDSKAWEQDERIKVDSSYLKSDEGVKPVEFVYAPENVNFARYIININRFGFIPVGYVEYNDMANGYEEAEKAPYRMEHFIDVSGERISLLKKNKNYVIPCYSEGGGREISFTRGKYQIQLYYWKDDNGKDYLHATIRNTDTNVCYKLELRKGVLKRVYKPYWLNFDAFCEGDRDYYRKKLHEALSETEFLGLKSQKDLTVQVNDDGSLVRVKNGNIVKVKTDGWIRWESIDSSEKDTINKELKNALTEGEIKDKEYKDLPMVMDKVKNKVLENAVFTIHKPKSIVDFELPPNEITNVSGHDQWGDCPIMSWQEVYEGTFTPYNLELNPPIDGETKFKYCVPVLSISHEDIPLKRFEFNTFLDSPRKHDLNPREYELQIRCKSAGDDCKELRFECDQPDSIRIEPTTTKPKDGTTVKIIYTGKYTEEAIITAKYNNKEKKPKLAGLLKVRVNAPKTASVFKAVAFMVTIVDQITLEGGSPVKVYESPSESFVEAIDDQFIFQTNILAQAGIKSEVNVFRINVNKADLTFNEDDELVNPDDVFFKAVVDKFGEEIYYVISQATVFFFVEKRFNKCAAYASENNGIPYEVFGVDLAFKRSRVYIIAHESLHTLRLGHSFQMQGCLKKNPFCFPLQRTSNIMDYSSLEYSLHKYQWEMMQLGMNSLLANRISKARELKRESIRKRIRSRNANNRKK